MESDCAAELGNVDEKLNQQMEKDIAAVESADAKENKIINEMTEDDLEKMLEKLIREANEGVPDGNMKGSHERLRRKLERRQKMKMLRERAAQQIAKIESESGSVDNEKCLEAKEEVSRDLVVVCQCMV